MEQSFTIPFKRPFKNIFQFKITLLGTKPQVWRRIQVPQSYTFYDLHVAIQDTMGWKDYHLHSFETKPRHEPSSISIECPFAEPIEEKEHELYTTEIPLTEFFKKVGDIMYYTYDFGDNWHHEVLYEGILIKNQKIKYPVCLDGKLACPPEDCGSIPGYYDCIKTLTDKKDKELLRWIGDWDPTNFDPKQIVFQNPKKRFIESWE
jgi:hypothetical protein